MLNKSEQSKKNEFQKNDSYCVILLGSLVDTTVVGVVVPTDGVVTPKVTVMMVILTWDVN